MTRGNVGISEQTNSEHGHSSFASVAVVKNPATATRERKGALG